MFLDNVAYKCFCNGEFITLTCRQNPGPIDERCEKAIKLYIMYDKRAADVIRELVTKLKNTGKVVQNICHGVKNRYQVFVINMSMALRLIKRKKRSGI